MSEPILKIAEPSRRRAMSRKIVFTEANLRALKCPAGRKVAWIHDARVGSLAFAVTANGARSFYFYRKHNGRPVRKAIGKLDKMTVGQARERVQALNAQYNDGVDAIAKVKESRAARTLGELWTSYRRQHLSVRGTAKTLRSEDSLVDSCLAVWNHRPLKTLTEDACRELHREIGVERGGVTANRALKLVGRLCRWARLPMPYEPDKIDWFPVASRERYLDASELKRLAAGLTTSADSDLEDFCTLALTTGARRDNVASMEWAEIDLDARLWRIPATKSKNKRPMPVPLAPAAVSTLKARAAHQAAAGVATPYVFPAGDGTRHRPGQGFYEAFVDVRSAVGLKDVTIHDLRRTCGSWMLASGASLAAIGRQLGHASVNSTAIYARMNLDGVRAAVNVAAAAMMKASRPARTRKRKEAPTTT